MPEHLSGRRIEPTWRPKPISVKKLVDDNLLNEKLAMKNVPRISDQGVVYKNARAGLSEQMFKHIATNAEKQGLLINAKKTALLTISGAVSYQAKSHIYTADNTRIDCQDSLKMLGFYFNKQGDVGAAAYQLGNTSSRTITEVKQR